MLFQNLSIPGKEGLFDISIENDMISAMGPGSQPKRSENNWLEFRNAMVFPGLINSHEHLDFNLFPQLGNGSYSNYRIWGQELHKRFKPAIQEVMQVPQPLRTSWGIYKNLINGFTTVVNHGIPLPVSSTPIRVIQENNILHSVGFEKYWFWKLNNPWARNLPFVVHIGEGTDKMAKKEIDRLIHWNLFGRKLFGVHGVAMTSGQASKFEGLIWCPASNFFMLGQTAEISKIRDSTRILFGTDSTLTAGWNAWDHFRMARMAMQVKDQDLFDMLTVNPATSWNLSHKGILDPGMKADLVIARIFAGPSWDSFFAINPCDILLVLQEGKIRLFDQELQPDLDRDFNLPLGKYSKVKVGKSEKFISGDLPALLAKIRNYHPGFEPSWEMI